MYGMRLVALFSSSFFIFVYLLILNSGHVSNEWQLIDELDNYVRNNAPGFKVYSIETQLNDNWISDRE